jgi:hypothetical protein
VFGHGLNECDDLRRETLRLTMGPGLSSPDDLEQIPMPAQQRLGADHVHGVSPSTGQSGEGEQQQPVVAVQSGPIDVATQYEDLLTEQCILSEEFRSRASEVTGGADHQSPSGACWPEQPLYRPDESVDQGDNPVRVHCGSVGADDGLGIE